MRELMDALIFDFDGVIVDSEKYWEKIENDAYQKIIPSNWTEEDHHRIVGMNFLDLYHLLTKEYNLQMDQEEFFSLSRTCAQKVYAQCTLIDGVQEFITSVSSHHIPLAIASSSRSEWILEVLNRFNLEKVFQTIASSEDLQPGEGKPAPTIFLKAAEKIGIDPQRCVVIEDSTNGVISAKCAGMYCIGFRNGVNDDQDLSQADEVISGFHELTVEAIENL